MDITYLGWRTGPQSIWTYLEFTSIVPVLINVFVPHIRAAIMFRGYGPGVVTAVLVNLPVLVLLFRLAIQERKVSGRKAVVVGIAVPVGMVSLVPVLFELGRWL